MKLFHFRDEIFGLKSIKERRLKLSRIMELNDPFEFLGASLANPEFRKAITSTKRQLSKTTGILCFSKNWQNPVQWSHYANKHKGICMCFEVPDQFPFEVEYVNYRLNVDAEIDLHTMYKFLSTKFIHWSYEEEWRLFVNLDKDEEENGLYFSDFSEKLELKQVIVGAQSDITRTQISDALGVLNENVEVFKARPAFKTFEVVRNKKNKLWA
jgi:hypothetical protein